MTQPALPVVLALVFLPFAGAAAVPLVYRALGERTAYFAAAVAGVCLLLVGSLFGTTGTVAVEWIPSLGVALRFTVDGLSLLIGLLASAIGVLILTYSGEYMHGEPSQPKYYASLLAFLGSMLGVAFAADLVALFVFWELTSLSSFLLIGHYQDESASQYAARKSMLITVAGGLFMLVGFLLLVVVSGEAFGEATFNLAKMLDPDNVAAMRVAMEDTGLLVPILLLLGVGAASKSAQVPLHIWLPNAMEAPTPVSAFLHSATMVKAGVYLVGRFRPLFVEPGAADLAGAWSTLFVTIGLLTMCVAAILAVASTDIKELLAYSTASHLGLIVAGFGFGSKYGAETGAFHIFNHATFKAALFLVAGIIAHDAGSRKIEELGGLRRDMPLVAVVAAVASLSMAGVPPLNGFHSKELLYEASYEAAVHEGGLALLLPVVAVFGSVFTFMYSIRFLMLFFGEKPDVLGDVHAPPALMLAPPALLAAVAFAVGLVPDLAVGPVVQDAFSAVGGEKTMTVSFPTTLKPAFVMSIVTIVLGAVGYQFYGPLHRGLRKLLSAGPLTANWYYDGAVDGLDRASDRTVALVQTGLIRTYATWVVASVVALALSAYLAAGVSFPAGDLQFANSVTVTVAFVLALACVGALAVTRAPSHIAGVLTLSIVGFMVAIFYILESAPDLALTQLVVETLVLLIFLLVLDKLPAFYGDAKRSVLARDAVLSGFVGLTMFVTVVVSTAPTDVPKISGYLAEHTKPGKTPSGGGHNIVNVILVDFRAFDTMGEIAVVAMAALSVVTLVAMRGRGETE
jgi:multicomponent Na+:H+ antiporter subunit A